MDRRLLRDVSGILSLELELRHSAENCSVGQKDYQEGIGGGKGTYAVGYRNMKTLSSLDAEWSHAKVWRTMQIGLWVKIICVFLLL